MEVKLLDHGYLKLVESWGSDERIIESARMSTDKGFQGWGPHHSASCGYVGMDSDPQPGCTCGHSTPGDEKLLSFLYNHKHLTPFEMAGMTIEVQAPLFVFREWHRHRTQCLSGDTKISCVSPSGKTYQRNLKRLFELKHGGVFDNCPKRHKNGVSKTGKPVTREARRKDPWRVRILPNCQNRTLRVIDEVTGEFHTGQMADVYESGLKPIWLLITKTKKLEASPQHPVFTQRGWVQMCDLTLEDFVARMGVIAANERVIPPALRSGIGVWTSMMRSRLISSTDTCWACQGIFNFEDLELDHVIPVKDDLLKALDVDNLKPICRDCHRKKINLEQPSRIGQTKRGIVWEPVQAIRFTGREEMTYDISMQGPHHNFVANELVVHNSYNELSSRYTELPNLFYIPSIERLMASKQSKSNKQSSQAGFSEEGAMEIQVELNDSYHDSRKVYESLLQEGVAREIARLVIPVAQYSRMRASANLRNWMAFLTLRMDPAAQWEIRCFANSLCGIMKAQFPRTHELFVGESSDASFTKMESRS